jgi:hypothetical protein
MVIPLHVREPAAYAVAKRRAAQHAGETVPSATGGVQGAGSGPQSLFGPKAVLFGSLDAVGLNAAQQILAFGEAGDVTPPDTTGAIGPDQYVEFVNNEVEAYERASLTPIGSPTGLTTFVGDKNTKGSVCDPQIKYDRQTSRWFYAAIECNGTTTENTLFMGFSKTTDPTDFSTAAGRGWCGYAYTTAKVLEDYPKLGLDPQHIIIGTNSFESAKPFNFLTAHIFSLPKPGTGKIETCPAAPVLTTFGSKAAPLRTSVENHIAFTPEPATVADESSAGFVVAADEAGLGKGKNIMIWRVGGTAEKPGLEPLGAPSVPSYSTPPPVPQLGSNDRIDSLDGRLTQAVAAADPNAGGEEAVWTQHTIAGDAGSVVRWYELIPGKAEVRQVGTISDPTKFAFNGAIAPTLSGGAVISYDTGSSTALVQVMAQSRIGSAPLGMMNTPITLASSSAFDADFSCPSVTGEEAPCRWGDYAGASVDPTRNNTVWGSNQINGPYAAGNAQWATQNFALEPNDVPPTASFTIAPNPATSGSPVGFNGSGSSDVDGSVAAYSWNFGDGSAAGSGAAPSHTYGAPGTYTVTLTVTDNGGETNAISQQIAVNAPSAPASTTTIATTATTAVVPPPNSGFGAVAATFNQKTGAITFTESVSEPGTFSWLLTFQNGKFGVFSASTSKCKKGFVRLNGKCRPSKIVYAKGSKAVAAAGSVTFTIKPSRSAMTALKNALKRKKGLPVTITLTFRSARGGSPVSRTRTMTVKLKKK